MRNRYAPARAYQNGSRRKKDQTVKKNGGKQNRLRPFFDAHLRYLFVADLFLLIFFIAGDNVHSD